MTWYQVVMDWHSRRYQHFRLYWQLFRYCYRYQKIPNKHYYWHSCVIVLFYVELCCLCMFFFVVLCVAVMYRGIW